MGGGRVKDEKEGKLGGKRVRMEGEVCGATQGRRRASRIRTRFCL